MLIKIFLNFFILIAIFRHIFELLWGLPNVPHTLGCQSVTSWRRASYHTPYESGYPELSYGSNSLNISGVIRELQVGETFKFPVPRRRSRTHFYPKSQIGCQNEPIMLSLTSFLKLALDSNNFFKTKMASFWKNWMAFAQFECEYV